MTFGLIFLIFLPIGIPVSLIIIPFLAGKNGASKLPKDWHWTYIITVGGGWSLGLVATIFILLSLALGPSLQINIAEPIIFAILIIFTWLSFAIGVRSSNVAEQSLSPYEQEWEEEEISNIDKEKNENGNIEKNIGKKKNKRILAIPSENKTNTDMFSKVKNFIKGSKNEENNKTKNKLNGKSSGNNSEKNKASRVSALANRRRK
jgi:hypothetical protein|tara:strand:+ start:114 stop:728 length:615 start_codon:yes stop_codon:yes gene_type:complete